MHAAYSYGAKSFKKFFIGKEEDFNAWMKNFESYLHPQIDAKDSCCENNPNKTSCDCQSQVVEPAQNEVSKYIIII